MCPLARFRLGTVNIDCFFQGMPEFCRRCRQYGHLAEGCELCQNCGKAGHEFKTCSLPKRSRQARCNKCGRPGHVAALCTFLKVCNMCGKEGHIYRDCPSKAKKEGAGAKLVRSGPGSEQMPAATLPRRLRMSPVKANGSLLMRKRRRKKNVVVRPSY
uniref:CCHC-type domain-containing protein n=1 Tax=Xenopus tropicalis TaxID=8364 RepID=A0A803JKA0_XENTR